MQGTRGRGGARRNEGITEASLTSDCLLPACCSIHGGGWLGLVGGGGGGRHERTGGGGGVVAGSERLRTASANYSLGPKVGLTLGKAPILAPALRD